MDKALGKVFFQKKSRNSLPSAWAGALGKVFFLKKTLSSVWAGAVGKVFKKKLCRVPGQRHSAKDFFKNPEILCRVPGLGHSAK